MKTNRYANKAETKNQILQTTLQILETEGFQMLTIRKIAAQAGVNVASVNYYFGSKDQVIFEALQALRARFGSAFEHLRDKQQPPRERLVAFMAVYCDTVFAYPNLVKAFVNQSLNAEIQQDYESFVRQEGLALITQTLAEWLPLDDEETLRMKAFQMMSSLVLILLVGKDVSSVIGLDFSDPQVRVRYIQTIVPKEAAKPG